MEPKADDHLKSVADLAKRVRKQALMMTSRANASHIGSSLSSVDVMAMLYGKVMRYDPARPDWPERDRFILSKGHACSALYAMLAECNFFGREWLDTLLPGRRAVGRPCHPHRRAGHRSVDRFARSRFVTGRRHGARRQT